MRTNTDRPDRLDGGRRTRARRRALLATVIVTALPVVAAAGPARAASPIVHGEGSYADTDVVVRATRQVGTTTIVSQTLSIDNRGVLDGPSTADVVCAFATSGEGACLGTEQFVGAVDGRTGSATFAVGLTVDATGFRGWFVTVGAEGGLAGLHGTGAFEGGSTGTNSFDHWFT